MAVALILTIIPVTLILVALVLTAGELGAIAGTSFVLLLGLVVIVFAGLIRAARRMQPSRDGGDRTRSEDPYEVIEDEPVEADPSSGDEAIARWTNEGGAARL